MTRRLLLTRLGWLLPSFLVITAVTFAVAHLAPGDPLQLSEDSVTNQAVIEDARRQLELDRPLLHRYGIWLGRLVRFDLGASVTDRRPVLDKIGEALPRTVVVSGLALLLAVAASIALGTFLARRTDRLSGALSASLALASGVPSFWVAVLLLLVFATPRGVEWFPLQGLASSPEAGLFDRLWHLVLPVACLALPTTAMLARYVREGVAAALEQDFIVAARSRGLDERRLLLRHALPNALVPVITIVGLQLPHVFAGSVVIERVFGIQGMGLLAYESIGTRDYPVVMGVSVVMAAVTLGSMFLTDLAAVVADPRARLPGSDR